MPMHNNHYKNRRHHSPLKKRLIKKKRHFELSNFRVQNIVTITNGGGEESRTPVQKQSHV